MKKTYINPTIYSRKVVVNNILAGSPGFESGNAGDGTVKQGTEGGGDGLAKESTWGNCWDE